MKKTLDYFMIEGAVGGNQEWFKNVVMYIGGCAAATACDCCIYLALRRGMRRLYPYDAAHLTREDYVAFSMKMKPYLRPRVNGVNKLYMFTEGFGKYLADAGERGLSLEELPGTESCGAAEDTSTADIQCRTLCSGTRRHIIRTLSGTGFCAMDMKRVRRDSGSQWRHTGSRRPFC